MGRLVERITQQNILAHLKEVLGYAKFKPKPHTEWRFKHRIVTNQVNSLLRKGLVQRGNKSFYVLEHHPNAVLNLLTKQRGLDK